LINIKRVNIPLLNRESLIGGTMQLRHQSGISITFFLASKKPQKALPIATRKHI